MSFLARLASFAMSSGCSSRLALSAAAPLLLALGAASSSCSSPAPPIPSMRVSAEAVASSNEHRWDGFAIVELTSDDLVMLDGSITAVGDLARALGTKPPDSVLLVVARDSQRWGAAVALLDRLGQEGRGPRRVAFAVRGHLDERTLPLSFPSALTPGHGGGRRIRIFRDGRVSIDGEAGAGSIQERLRAAPMDSSKPRATVVLADVSAPFGVVVDATRALQEAGAPVAFGVASPVRGGATTSGIETVPSPGAAAGDGPRIKPLNGFCPFPPEADRAEIDEASVTLLVVLDDTGAIKAATVVSDPGNGFGQAAIACIEHAEVEPTRDAAGKPVAEKRKVVIHFAR